MSNTLRVEFAQDMPPASVEVVAPSLEVVSRFMLAAGRFKDVPVGSKASFLRVYLGNGDIATLRDPGNLQRVIHRWDLKRKKRDAKESQIRSATATNTDQVPLAFSAVPGLTSRVASAYPLSFSVVGSGPFQIPILTPRVLSSEDWLFNFTGVPPGPPYRLAIDAGGHTVKITLPQNLANLRMRMLPESSPTRRCVQIRLRSTEPTADAILGYLQRGDLHSAELMLEWVEEAEELLEAKMKDPYAAAVAGYLLLRLQKLEKRRAWLKNLAEWFPDLPDGAVILACQLLNKKRPGSEEEVGRAFMEAASRGLPVYTQGVRLLLDGLRRLGPMGEAARQRVLQGTETIEWRSPLTAVGKSSENPTAVSELPLTVDCSYGDADDFSGEVSDPT